MSLLAEEIAEEWLNQERFFTIRGLKVGHGEIDLLAIRPEGDSLLCRHIEVQCSVNPVSYICGLPRTLQSELGLGAYSARRRADDHMAASVKGWIEKKFRDPEKVKVRSRLGPGPWSEELVVNVVKHPDELEYIRTQGIKVHQLGNIIRELLERRRGCLRASGSDFIDLLRTAATGAVE